MVDPYLSDKIEVGMEDYEGPTNCKLIHTIGLGPCVGVAISYLGQGLMLHVTNGWMNSDLVTEFLKAVNSTIPLKARQAIYPVVAGGCLEFDDPEFDKIINDDTKHSREYVVKQLLNYGFGEPRIHWCPAGHAQDLHLNTETNTVEIHTSNTATDAKATIISVKLN